MIWVAWRRHRTLLLTLAGLLLVLGGGALVLRGLISGDSARLLECNAWPDRKPGCSAVSAQFHGAWGRWPEYAEWIILAFPVLAGLFIGGPLFARDAEQGTDVLVFTQSVTRSHWILSVLAVTLVPTLLVMFGLQWSAGSLLSTASDLTMGVDPWTKIDYHPGNLLFLGYTVFAVGLGAFAGAFLRNSLGGMAVVLAGYFPVWLGLGTAQPAVGAEQRLTYGLEPSARPGDVSAVATGNSGFLNTFDRQVDIGQLDAVVQRCMGKDATIDCLRDQGIVSRFIDVRLVADDAYLHLRPALALTIVGLLLLFGAYRALHRRP
ncbi:hypothetical protein D5S17_06325 [Pseudonocardiaceae bacterium YIM PH 21723]|nr:hypothetical protein D5S17_06325 [Pseudonocardiaceae bacterium YIM PH 21723]